jgi:hypothetical protein
MPMWNDVFAGADAVAQHAGEKEGNCEHPSIMF